MLEENMTLDDYRYAIAKKSLSMGAIRLSPEKPFRWASGYFMPIYNDNRTLLGDPEARTLIAEAFSLILKEIGFDPQNIAGTSTAGIPHATTLADKLNKPLSYVRSSNKDHGLKNQIEGLGKEGSYNNKEVLLIEDLISTGGSSIQAVNAIREANGQVPYCLAIFSYGTKQGKEAFENLDPVCKVQTILTYDYVISIAKETGYIKEDQVEILQQWSLDPFEWGNKNGFPKEG
ncbi:MAG: orotate phosphoribosyltransferase [Sphaerochaetaceae bacterium]|nr:orotate phosphoribosyltransferase [Sphaerochaetaceae bacterium]